MRSGLIWPIAVPCGLLRKVKVNITLQQATKAQKGSRCMALLLLQPRRYMGGGVNATPRPDRLTFQEGPGTHCTGGWVGSRTGLDGFGISGLPPGFDPRNVQSVANRYTDCANPAPTVSCENCAKSFRLHKSLETSGLVFFDYWFLEENPAARNWLTIKLRNSCVSNSRRSNMRNSFPSNAETRIKFLAPPGTSSSW